MGKILETNRLIIRSTKLIERELESQKDFLRLLHIPRPNLGQDNKDS